MGKYRNIQFISFFLILVVGLGNFTYAEDLPSRIIPGYGWMTVISTVTYYVADLYHYRDLNSTEKANQLDIILDIYDEGNEIWIPSWLEESATITCNCHGFVFLGFSGSGWTGNGVIIDPTGYLTSEEYSVNNACGEVCRFTGHSAFYCGQMGPLMYWAKMSVSAPWAYHSDYGEGGAYGPHYQRWDKNP